jgi:hypothetical protein
LKEAEILYNPLLSIFAIPLPIPAVDQRAGSLPSSPALTSTDQGSSLDLLPQNTQTGDKAENNNQPSSLATSTKTVTPANLATLMEPNGQKLPPPHIAPALLNQLALAHSTENTQNSSLAQESSITAPSKELSSSSSLIFTDSAAPEITSESQPEPAPKSPANANLKIRGTLAAHTRLQMNDVDKMNKIAGQDQKELSGARLAREEMPTEPSNVVTRSYHPMARAEITEFNDELPSGLSANSAPLPGKTDDVILPNKVSPAPDVERLQRLSDSMASSVMELKLKGANSMDVTLRPEPGLEVRLHLQWKDGQAQAQVLPGNESNTWLQQNWSHLQSAMSARGIQLSPLQVQNNQAPQVVNTNISQENQSFSESTGQERNRQFRQQYQDIIPPEIINSNINLTARKIQPPKVGWISSRRQEYWA